MARMRARDWSTCGTLAMLIAGCATRSAAPKAIEPAPVTTPAKAPATDPAPGGARFLDAIPNDLSPELAQQIGFLSDVCNVAMSYESGGAHRIHVGCRSCPPFEGPAAVSDGRIAVDGRDFFELELFVAGHFTAPDADQRLAVFNGCERHSPARERPFSKPQVTTLQYRFDGQSFVPR